MLRIVLEQTDVLIVAQFSDELFPRLVSREHGDSVALEVHRRCQPKPQTPMELQLENSLGSVRVVLDTLTVERPRILVRGLTGGGDRILGAITRQVIH